MLTEADHRQIQLLNNELSILSKARNRIETLLEEKLPKDLYKEICPEITGVLMFAQNSLHQRIERLKNTYQRQEYHEKPQRFRF